MSQDLRRDGSGGSPRHQLFGTRGSYLLAYAVPTLVLIAAMLAIPLRQLDFLARIPGDIGDGRLNNYFLEHALQSVVGLRSSLWSPQFFAPHPFVLGFSDNLLGSLPVYALVRAFTHQTDTAFQIWFLVGYVANFVSCLYVLRRLGMKQFAALVGALVFAFALPTSAHAMHAQLHYRFAIPLAIFFLIDFLRNRRWRSFFFASLWTVCQLYLGIYMGSFLLVLEGALIVTAIALWCIRKARSTGQRNIGLYESWISESVRVRLSLIVAMLACVGLLVLLFYPYVWVQARYQYRRDWTDVLDVLPRPQSFLLSDVSSLWRHPNAGIFRDLPSRHEHQMFIGAAPLLFALIGAIRSVEKNSRTTKLYMVGMIALPIVATLWLNGWTLWKVFFALPLASAIKVITRVDQALLFPIAFLAAFGVQAMIDRKRRLITGFAVALSGFLILEAALVDMPTSAKQEWRDRSAALETQLPDVVDQNRILFVAQRSGPNYADELDVMWYALKAGVPTMNGYSGYAPWGYGWDYGTECSTIPNRVLWYLEFEDREHDLEAYRSLMARIEHIGFTNCDPRWWDEFTGY